MATKALQGFDALLFVKTETQTTFNQVAEVRNLKIAVNEKFVDITKYRNEGFREWGNGMKGWEGSADYLYCKDDAAQDALFTAIRTGTPLFIKMVPNKDFDATTLQREIFGGLCVIKNWQKNVPNADAVATNIVFTGRGPIENRGETSAQAASGDFCFCIEWYQTVYLSLNQVYTPPVAPSFSTGWEIDPFFYTKQSGTGNLPTITINAAFLGTLLSNTLNGCPIPISMRYKCEGGPIIPSGSGTSKDDFLEIAPVTQDTGQLKVIEIMEDELDKKIGVGGVTFSSLYDDFDTFLLANTDFVMDLSGLRISNLEMVNTLTNLKGLNVNNNLINGVSMNQMPDLNLITFKAKNNFIGSDHGKLIVHMVSTLKTVDFSDNILHESFLFGAAGGGPFTVDFFDVSENFIASISNEDHKIKEFIMRDNIFPADDGGFWDSNTFRKAVEIAQPARVSEDRSVAIKYDFSNSDIDDPHDTTLTTLRDNIKTAQSISQAEADSKVVYDPDFDDGVHGVYTPLKIYADQDTDEGFEGE